MRLYLGAPQRALWQWVFSEVGEEPCWVILPNGVPPLTLPPNAERMDTRALLARLSQQPDALELTQKHTALMAQVCARWLNNQSYFGKVRHLPGFHRQLVQRITEWHLDGISPKTLEQGAQAVLDQPPEDLSQPELQQEWRKKTDELVRLWNAWRSELAENDLTEPAQEWWRVVSYLRQNPPEDLRPCVWFGFTRLRAVELVLLKVLNVLAPQHFALLCDPTRPTLFEPTLKLREQITTSLPCEERWLMPIALTEPNALSALEQGFWATEAPTAHTGTPLPIQVLDVPNPLMEVEAVAREILQLHENGYTYSDIALLLRQPASVIETLEVVFGRYGIPFSGEVSLPLLRSPNIRWLLQGLRLLVGRERWSAWVDWFRHPFFGFSPLQLRRLENLRRVESPNDALDRLRTRYPEERSLIEWLQFCIEQRARLQGGLYPIIQELARRLPSPSAQPSDIERDDIGVFLQLASAYQEEVRPLPPERALAYLERLAAGSSYTQRWSRDGVRLLSPEHSDLVGFKVVFLLSLLEGVYPYRHPDEPFLRETERLALRERLQPTPNLPTRSELQAGEPLLFYRALTTATERLYLTYPRTQNESDALPSFYLREVERAIGRGLPTQVLTLDQIVPPTDECLHPYDQILSEGKDYTEPSETVHEQALRELIANLDREFSVSELESLVRCPFQHLMRYIWRVRPKRRGLQITQVGTVVHQSLYKLLQESDDPLVWTQRALEVLTEAIAEHLDDLSDWQKQVVQAFALRMLNLFIALEPLYRQQLGMHPIQLEWAFGTQEGLDDEERTVVLPSPQSRPQSIPYRVGAHQIALRGVIDRIDATDDPSTRIILDYKLSSAPRKSDFKDGRALQFLLYADVARTMLAQNHPNPEIVIACDSLARGTRTYYYVHNARIAQQFAQVARESHCNRQPFSRSEWLSAFQNLRATLQNALNRLTQADVSPTPDQHCQWCTFGDVCRKAQWRV